MTAISPKIALQRPGMGQMWGIRRTGINLIKTTAKISDVFRVYDGSVQLMAAYMEITTACSANVCNMAWIFDSDAGGDRIIGAAVSITSAALGDFIWAELDGSALVVATTSTGLIHGGVDRKVVNVTDQGSGTILTEGGIDITLAGANALTAGKATMSVVYRPLIEGAVVSYTEAGIIYS